MLLEMREVDSIIEDDLERMENIKKESIAKDIFTHHRRGAENE